MKYLEIINEVSFYDTSSLMPLLQKYKDKWIHFTNGVNKNPHIGINYNITVHGDPKGIYFYPISWLLSDQQRVKDEVQYGLGMKYFYICDIKLNPNSGIDLSKLTWNDFYRIAKENGWYDDYEKFINLPEDKLKYIKPTNMDLDNPTSAFWKFIKINKNVDREIALKNVDWIFDDAGIINEHEPEQLIVRKPSLVKIIVSGELKNDKKSIDKWKYFLNNIFAELNKFYDGEISWKNKLPTYSFSIGNNDFKILITEAKLYGGEKSFKMTLDYNSDNKKSSMVVADPIDGLDNFDDYIEKITKKVDSIINQKNIDIGPPYNEEAKELSFDLIKNELFNNLNTNPSFTITYGDGYTLTEATSEYINHNIIVTGKIKFVINKPTDYSSYIDVSLTLMTGGTIYNIINNDLNTSNNNTINWTKFADIIKDDISYFDVPLNNNGTIVSQDEHDQFIGYLMLSSKLSFNGEIQKVFSNEIESYLSLNNDKKHDLIDKMLYLLEKIAY